MTVYHGGAVAIPVPDLLHSRKAGGVTNDKVFDALEAFFAGFAPKEQTIGRLRMATPNLQICLRSEAALRALVFIGSEPV